MKKSPVTQELVNIYPSWSRVRQNEQALGHQYLNTLAKPMEYMEKSLAKMKANQFLVTANLDEIDLVYRATLPTTFSFGEDTSDPAITRPEEPTVSGLLGGTWYDVSLAEDNDLQSFWYDSIPDRASLDDTLSGVDHELLSFTTSGISVSGLWEHHLGGGHIFIETSGGIKYVDLVDDELRRGKVTVWGKTRQGVEESETVVFPWDQRQKLQKEWKSLTKVETWDLEDGITVTLTSASFAETDYLDPWNIRYSDDRKKIDQFWGVGITASGTSLERIGYITDEWQQLILGFVDKEAKVAWDLRDESGNYVTAVDIAVQAFSDNIWAITAGGMLYCYSSQEDMPSGLDYIRDRTAGTPVQIDVEPRWCLLGETIDFIPWYARPLREIVKHRVWYQTPNGTRYGVLNGSPVSYSSDFWVFGAGLQRSITDLVSLQALEWGEYLLVVEAQLDDEITYTDKVLVSVNYKLPLTTIDLGPLISGTVEGIDFDSDQRMWVKTTDQYYQIGLHTDIMLIDYTNKIMYFKEPYSEVVVETNG